MTVDITLTEGNILLEELNRRLAYLSRRERQAKTERARKYWKEQADQTEALRRKMQAKLREADTTPKEGD